MVMKVQCCLCDEILELTAGDTVNLLNHTKSSHQNALLKRITTKTITPDCSLNPFSNSFLSANECQSTSKDVLVPPNGSSQSNKCENPINNRPTTLISNTNTYTATRKSLKNAPSSVEKNEMSPLSTERPNKKAQLKQEKEHWHGSCHCFPAPKSKQNPIRSKMADCLSALTSRATKAQEPFKMSKRASRQLYIASIKKWQPGSTEQIFCPRCGAMTCPLVYSRSRRVTRSVFGAAFILTCWPLCFSPCLFTAPTRTNLHCSKCKHFLAVYDHRKAKIFPTREASTNTTPPNEENESLLKTRVSIQKPLSHEPTTTTSK